MHGADRVGATHEFFGRDDAFWKRLRQNAHQRSQRLENLAHDLTFEPVHGVIHRQQALSLDGQFLGGFGAGIGQLVAAVIVLKRSAEIKFIITAAKLLRAIRLIKPHGVELAAVICEDRRRQAESAAHWARRNLFAASFDRDFARLQISNPRDMREILVAHRQKRQHIADRLEPRRAQLLRGLWPDPFDLV